MTRSFGFVFACALLALTAASAAQAADKTFPINYQLSVSCTPADIDNPPPGCDVFNPAVISGTENLLCVELPPNPGSNDYLCQGAFTKTITVDNKDFRAKVSLFYVDIKGQNGFAGYVVNMNFVDANGVPISPRTAFSDTSSKKVKIPLFIEHDGPTVRNSADTGDLTPGMNITTEPFPSGARDLKAQVMQRMMSNR